MDKIMQEWPSDDKFNCVGQCTSTYPDSKVRGANMGPIWDQKDPGGPHVGPMNLVIWVSARPSASTVLTTNL